MIRMWHAFNVLIQTTTAFFWDSINHFSHCSWNYEFASFLVNFESYWVRELIIVVAFWRPKLLISFSLGNKVTMKSVLFLFFFFAAVVALGDKIVFLSIKENFKFFWPASASPKPVVPCDLQFFVCPYPNETKVTLSNGQCACVCDLTRKDCPSGTTFHKQNCTCDSTSPTI